MMTTSTLGRCVSNMSAQHRYSFLGPPKANATLHNSSAQCLDAIVPILDVRCSLKRTSLSLGVHHAIDTQSESKLKQLQGAGEASSRAHRKLQVTLVCALQLSGLLDLPNKT